MRTNQCGLATVILAALCATPASFAQTPDSCDAIFARSTTISPLLTPVFAAMQSKDAAKQASLLPSIETQLNALPSLEIKPEFCSGNHINAYTTHQFAELSALRARNIDIGFPANMPIVKQPDLNQATLAYSVGWIKYEKNDFTGALAAYSKGLAMFPHEPSLQQEYLATLVQLKRYTDVVTYTDKVLTTSYSLSDENRAKTYQARAIALMSNNDLKAADEAMSAALKYQYTDESAALQTQIRDAMKPKPAPAKPQ